MDSRRDRPLSLVRRVPRAIIGWRRSDVEQHMAAQEAAHLARVEGYEREIAAAEVALGASGERLRSLRESLERTLEQSRHLRGIEAEARASAQWLEDGVGLEVQRLDARHAERLREWDGLLPGVEADIARSEARLRALLDAVAGALAPFLDGQPQSGAAEGSGVAFSGAVAAVLGSLNPPDQLLASWLGQGYARLSVPQHRVRVQARGGQTVGWLTALIVAGFPPELGAYEVTPTAGSPVLLLPADVLALQRNLVIVRPGYAPRRLEDIGLSRLPGGAAYGAPAWGLRVLRPPVESVGPLHSGGEPSGTDPAEVADALWGAALPGEDHVAREADAGGLTETPDDVRPARGVESTLGAPPGGPAARSEAPSATEPPGAVESPHVDVAVPYPDPIVGLVPGLVAEPGEEPPSPAAVAAGSAVEATDRSEPSGSGTAGQAAAVLDGKSLADLTALLREAVGEGAGFPDVNAGSPEVAEPEVAEPAALGPEAPGLPAAGPAALQPPAASALPAALPLPPALQPPAVLRPSGASEPPAAALPSAGGVPATPLPWLHAAAVGGALPEGGGSPGGDPASESAAASAEAGVGAAPPVRLPGLPPPAWSVPVSSEAEAEDESEPQPGAVPNEPRPAAVAKPQWAEAERGSRTRPRPEPDVPDDLSPPAAAGGWAAAAPGGPLAAIGDDVLVFLRGKVVGQDIYDDLNRLVAQRGSVIDEGLVRAVEAAGRLPELIVHMTLPEVGL